MATGSSPEGIHARDIVSSALTDGSDILAEVLAAEADFEHGDYIDLTREQLAHAIETGVFPWPAESLD